jgi:membrane-associated phospholipid phosphatase
VQNLRETVPLFACFLIYTNLHDTIGFVNPNDVHDRLVALDAAIFGVQPCVWAQRFITPGLTELMQFFYLNFFWIAPSVSVVLLLQRRFVEFRAATVGVIACFFVGYALYVAFPAAPPRLVLIAEFTKNLRGYPVGFSSLSAEAFSLLPTDSRAAFPSLHTAASTVALVYAWRFLRPWFYVLLPFVLGLWISTIYLRHHYFVDLVAGWALAPVAVWLAPRIDAWWAKRQRDLGYVPARGAGSGLEVGLTPAGAPERA